MNITKTILAALLCCAALAACHHDDHDHDHHAHILLSAYTDLHELFVEMSPLEEGEEAHVVCRVTRLADFKPIEGGRLAVSLSVDGAKTACEPVNAENPGEFHLHITPSKKGNATLVFTLTGSSPDTFTIDSLRVFDNEEEAHEDAEAREVTGANTVAFTKTMSWGIDFATAEVALEQVGTVIRTVSQVLPSQGDETIVVAKTAGVVHIADRSLTEGCAVSAGKVLCRVDASSTANDNLAAKQQQQLAELQRAKGEYERVKALREDRLALESELAAAKAAYETALAAYNALQKGFAQGVQTVTAPRGGFLKQLMASNGQYVEAGTPLAVITQSRTLQLKAEVPSSYYPDLKNVCGANIVMRDATVTLAQLGGRMLSYGHQVDTASPLVPVVFEINNTVDLLPGTFVETFILTRGDRQALCVPAEAIMEEMGTHSVFVQLTPELFEKRQVNIGVTDGVRTEVLTGVALGERVVGKGAVSLKLQQAVGDVDPHAGHNH